MFPPSFQRRQLKSIDSRSLVAAILPGNITMAALLLLASLVGSALAVPVDMNLLPRAASYPEGWQTPPQSMTPQPWLDALQAAVSSGKIPNVPVATADSQGNIDYPNNAANDPATCSWTVTKCNGPGDIYEAPNNTIAVAFDDGPTEYSNQLYDFLQQQNQPATHFM